MMRPENSYNPNQDLANLEKKLYLRWSCEVKCLKKTIFQRIFKRDNKFKLGLKY